MEKRGFSLVELIVVVSFMVASFIVFSPSLFCLRENVIFDSSVKNTAMEVRLAQIEAISAGRAVKAGDSSFVFARSGAVVPGGSGTKTLASKFGKTRKIVVSSIGRVRVE